MRLLSKQKFNTLKTGNGAKLWVITVDSYPMPYEIHQCHSVVVGSEEYVSAVVNELNAKNPDSLFEYSECIKPRIMFENKACARRKV
jgi:hypothetical protein